MKSNIKEFNNTGVSVVIAAIPPRVGNLLDRAIESAEAQLLSPEEIIVTIDESHEGEAATRNKGLFQVKTKWTAFLDDDDYLRPHHLSSLVQAAEETQADLVYPYFYVENGTDVINTFGEAFDPEKLRLGNYIPVTTLVRTELAQKVGGFPEPMSKTWPFPTCVDWGFLLRLLDAGASFYHLPERTWVYRWHPKNTSGYPWKNVYEENKWTF